MSLVGAGIMGAGDKLISLEEMGDKLLFLKGGNKLIPLEELADELLLLKRVESSPFGGP